MKVIYISHYRETSGVGHSSREYLRALISAGIEVVARPIILGLGDYQLEPELLEAENKYIDGATHCIQYLLPHHMMYNGNYKNIGMFIVDSIDWHYSGWNHYLNMMDEIWVPNNEMKTSLKENRVDLPCHVIPIPTNVTKYRKTYNSWDNPAIAGNFMFYTICELNVRKRLPALIASYLTTFNPSEPVSLVIKCNKSGMSSKDISNSVTNTINEVKTSLKLYANPDNYQNIFVVGGFLDDNELMSIHQRGNCFVTTSYGEGWCLPAFDALCMNNPVISSNCGGLKDFVPSDYLVKGKYTNVVGMTDTFQSLHTGREKWFNVDIEEFGKKMRYVYEKDKLKRPRINEDRYSYYSIGNLMKEVLCG